MLKAAEKRLSHRRFTHVLGVSHAAAILAQCAGAPQRPAIEAGLLHDLAKEVPLEELKEDLERRGCPIPAEDESHRPLWHAWAASVWAAQDFGIDDPDILEAIRLHPTADADISRVAQVVFLADYTDPTRNWDGVEDLRRLARRDFDAAFSTAIERKIAHVRARGKAVHIRGERALAFYGNGSGGFQIRKGDNHH
jgi:predicted HD superfamily hydrolase involved in NAD metabolism